MPQRYCNNSCLTSASALRVSVRVAIGPGQTPGAEQGIVVGGLTKVRAHCGLT